MEEEVEEVEVDPPSLLEQVAVHLPNANIILLKLNCQVGYVTIIKMSLHTINVSTISMETIKQRYKIHYNLLIQNKQKIFIK